MAISLENVTKAYLSKTGSAHVAIRDVTLRVRRGSFVSLVGPTGCGKSTLVGLIAGLNSPTIGTVSVNGVKVAGVLPNVGLLFQKDSLLPWRTVLDNVAIPLRYRGVGRTPARRAAEEWLKRVGLAEHVEKYPHQLSGGMRKRVSLAQTMVYDPEILLMDEPFSALDAQTRAIMENDLLDIWSASKKTVLFITHDLDEAISLSDEIAVMTAGPGTIKAIEMVELSRPRNLLEVRSDILFSGIHSRLWDHLREEVIGREHQ